MEFGLFLGGFVHRDLAAANANAEHDRLMSEPYRCCCWAASCSS